MGLKITSISSKNLDFSTILQCFRTPNTHSFTLGIGLVRYPNHRAHQNPVRIVLREGRSILKPNLRSRGDWHILLPTRQTAPARSYIIMQVGISQDRLETYSGETWHRSKSAFGAKTRKLCWLFIKKNIITKTTLVNSLVH